MGGFISKWAVRQDQTVTEDDVGPDGSVRDDTLERWVAAACSAYLDRCPVLQATRAREGLELRQRTGDLPRGGRLGRPASVLVTARATELLPSSFRVAVRLRPLGEERDVAVDVTCEVWLEDPATGEVRDLDRAVRDELIEIEHAAQHYG
jgi:acyl-CoA thioesterase FadM